MGTGYHFRNKGAHAEILIYEDVGGYFGGVTAKDIRSDLKAVSDSAVLNVRINSYGGEVFEGLAIHRAISDFKGRKVVHVDGIAASIAAVIAMAGDEVIMTEAGRMMIHNAAGIAVGEAKDLRSAADQLESITGSLVDIFAGRTGHKADKVKAWMDAETWFTAADAVSNRFANSVAGAQAVMARYDPRHHSFKNAPAGLVAQAHRPVRDELSERVAALRARVARQ